MYKWILAASLITMVMDGDVQARCRHGLTCDSNEKARVAQQQEKQFAWDRIMAAQPYLPSPPAIPRMSVWGRNDLSDRLDDLERRITELEDNQ